MPVFSCGGMRYQHSWQDVDPEEIDPTNQRNIELTIEKALSVGINHIETARGYGTSEIQLGRILPQLPRDEIIVQTKAGPKEDPAEFRRVVELSLANLQLDSVDLLALHGINNAELLRHSLHGCLEEAHKLRQEGRCRWVGFSTHAAPEIIIEAINSGGFDYVNLHWYFVQDRNWPAVLAARRQDMGVFIISPNDKGGRLYEPSKKLHELCHPLTPMQFNDLYCLARDEVHTLSLGAARASDFDEHVDAMRAYPHRLRTVDPMAKRIRRSMRQTLGAGWYDHWRTGIPNWERTPGKINIGEILRLWTFATALDMQAYAKARYNLLGNAKHWFPGENAARATELKSELRASLEQSPLADRILEVLEEAHQSFYDGGQKRLSESEEDD